MKNALVALVICFTFSAPTLLASQGSPPGQLEDLLAPVALYPDPLLAQILTAATFVDQIDEASRALRANSDPKSIDAQSWDVSVKAVAHYPIVLNMMSAKLDWTTSLGQAWVSQPADVMAAIQRLRAMALKQGNLVSNPQQQVIQDGDYISIDPAQAQYLYVPLYDPSIVYYRQGGNDLSFGARCAIGAWLNYDFNWRNHSIYYHGWESGHAGWIDRSRRSVVVNNTYVNDRFRSIQVNHGIVGNEVNHSDVNYGKVFTEDALRALPPITVVGNPDARIDASRGRQPAAVPSGTSAQPAPSQPALVPSTTFSQPDDGGISIDPLEASQRGEASRHQPMPTQPMASQPRVNQPRASQTTPSEPMASTAPPSQHMPRGQGQQPPPQKQQPPQEKPSTGRGGQR
jgi:hypothetical protein